MWCLTIQDVDGERQYYYLSKDNAIKGQNMAILSELNSWLYHDDEVFKLDQFDNETMLKLIRAFIKRVYKDRSPYVFDTSISKVDVMDE